LLAVYLTVVKLLTSFVWNSRFFRIYGSTTLISSQIVKFAKKSGTIKRAAQVFTE